MKAHLSSLEDKHHKLDAWITEESAHPYPDFGKLQTWKKQKLVLKEEVERLRLLERLEAA